MTLLYPCRRRAGIRALRSFEIGWYRMVKAPQILNDEQMNFLSVLTKLVQIYAHNFFFLDSIHL
jgi:hypothetical protein